MLSSGGFDLWAGGYDKSVHMSDECDTYPFAGYKRVLGAIYEAIRGGAGRRVLDVGIGTGVLAGRLYADGYGICGVDFSQSMLAIARGNMPAAELLLCDFAGGLPEELRGRRFDFIVCTYAIHHLTYARQADFIAELRGQLAESGRLLIGDVAFETRGDMQACRAQCGDDWDADEFYPIAGELRGTFPGLKFTRISHCAGVFEFG